MSEGINDAFLRKNPLVEKELVRRIKAGDSIQELIVYLKTTKWPGALTTGNITNFVGRRYPKENIQYLIDAGLTESEINKLTSSQKKGYKDSIRNYRRVLLPHLKKYDGTVESLVIEGVRENTNLDHQLKKFRKETNPKLLKLLEKEVGNPEFRAKIAQNQLNKLVESGGTDDIRIQRSLTSRLLKEQPTKEAWAAGEKWIADNAPIYDDPNRMRIDFIKKFGKDHPLIKGIKTEYNPLKGFSADFTRDVLGSPKEMKLSAQNLKNIFNAAIYNFNDDVRLSILNKIKDMYEKGPAATRYQARKEFNNPLFKKYNLNERIDGPIGRLIKLDLDKKVYEGLKALRSPRMDTIKHIEWLADHVNPQYKKMFNETVKALQFAQQKQWPEAKKQLGIAQNITFEHKIPQRLIDRGYADPIEYIKVVPTQRKFNEMKYSSFDRPLTNYITKYEAASPTNKAKWLNKMIDLKDRFNKKYGNYLGDVRIEEVDGNIKLRSLGQAVTEETNLMASLRAALKQEKGIVPRSFLINAAKTNTGGVCKIPSIVQDVAGGGRIGFAAGSNCAREMEIALNKNPVKVSQDIIKLEETTPALGKIKNVAKGFLGFLGKVGPAAGKYGAIAAAGALAQPLVKQFRNDDPSTYLTDPDQEAGMLTALIEGERPKPRSEILDWGTTAGALGATAAAVPGTSALYKARRGYETRIPKAGPITEAGLTAGDYLKRSGKGYGVTRAALGPVGKLVSGMFTPAGLMATEPLRIAQKRREGESWGEIATSPTMWMGPAFAPSMTRMATRGMNPASLLPKLLRLGMSRAALAAMGPVGWAGLAASLGWEGRKQYQDYKKGRGFFASDEE